MNTFSNWLKKDIPFGMAISQMLLFMFCWSITAAIIINTVVPDGLGSPAPDLMAVLSTGTLPDVAVTMFMVSVAVLWEEFIFRGVPLGIAMVAVHLRQRISKIFGNNSLRGKYYKLRREYMIPVGVVTSMIFGFLHGGVWNIFIQGVVGLILSLYFIKLSNIRASKAFFAVYMAHIAFNAVSMGVTIIVSRI